MSTELLGCYSIEVVIYSEFSWTMQLCSAASTVREYLEQLAAVVVLAADAAKRLPCVRMLPWQVETAAAGRTALFSQFYRVLQG